MKRYICLLTIAASLFFCSCNTSEGSQAIKSVNFYYCNESISYNSANGIIISEARNVEDYTHSLERLLALYLKGPISPGFLSPFPNGLQIETITESNNRIQITLSSEFAELTGIDMTLACACLEKTIQELAEIEYLFISYDNTATGKRQTIMLGPDSFLLVDDSAKTDNSED